MRQALRFYGWPALSGLLLAAVIILLFPQWFGERLRLPASPLPGSGPVSYAAAVEQAAPAVVNLYTARLVSNPNHPLTRDPGLRPFFGDNSQQQRMESSLGSGVILSELGYILTNNHVVEGADQIIVALKDGRETYARVVGTDPETDLAVLKIALDGLPAIRLGDSDEIRIGDVSLAIGNPFGVGQTVTMGIISATGRNHLGLNTYEDFIQTDAAINPGNSGGALVDAYGNLIGINTAIFSRSGGSQGIGFAIPVRLAMEVMEAIIEHGRVIRGWLGIEVQPMTPALAESFGLPGKTGIIVAGIYRHSPAIQAGLLPGDVLLAIDGELILDARQAMNQVARKKPGEELQVDLARQGRTLSLMTKVAQRPIMRRVIQQQPPSE